MKNISSILLFLIFLSINPLSVLAKPLFPFNTTFQSSNQNTTNNLRLSQTKNNTLVATISNNLQIDLGKKQIQTINLILMQPFNNFPAGSYLKATINPTEDGNAILIAHALYGNNQMLKISANSEILYGQTVTISNRSQEALKRTSFAAPFGGLLSTAIGEDVESIIQMTGIAGTVGYATGFLSPQQIQLLNLSAHTPIFFTINNN